jgi:hypothetical protein
MCPDGWRTGAAGLATVKLNNKARVRTFIVANFSKRVVGRLLLAWALNRMQNSTLIEQIRRRDGRKLGLGLRYPAGVAWGTVLRHRLG